MTVKRMDEVGIVVKDLDAAIRFFTELDLTLEGRMPIDGEWDTAPRPLSPTPVTPPASSGHRAAPPVA